jgi:methylglutaconyl-CoA hydratase
VTGPVRYSAEGGVATLTLDSHHNRNALSAELMTGLLEGIERAVADDTVRVLLLTHTGTVFCSGVDLKSAGGPAGAVGGSAGAAGGPVGAAGGSVASLPAILTAICESPKPVVARVGGPARAGGLGLIGAADIAVASTEATFAFTEVRIGVVPAVISATVLPRLAPRAAAELFLTGDVFGGQRAAEIGLVTAAVPAVDLDTAIDGYVQSLLRGGPGALAATKRLLPGHEAESLRQQLRDLTSLSVEHFTSEEGREGVASFRERRDPSWVPKGL